jgi:hypothetical protein
VKKKKSIDILEIGQRGCGEMLYQIKIDKEVKWVKR